MESAERILLSKLSLFKIKKISKSLKPKTVKKLKNGTLLIEICYKNQTDEILKWKHFDNSLNTCKGVVKSYELSLCSSDEIKTNLQEQNVMEIWRIQIKRKTGETIDTNTYVITFNTDKIPKEIKIGCQKINFEPYIPNPLRCYKCQRFSHHQDQCTQPPVCVRCGEYDIYNDNQKDY